MGKNQQDKGVDRLSNKCSRFGYFIYARGFSFFLCSALRGYFVQTAGHAGCPLSGVERCLLLGGSKFTISIGRAIRGMDFFPLYRGCPPSGFTVNQTSSTSIMTQTDRA